MTPSIVHRVALVAPVALAALAVLIMLTSGGARAGVGPFMDGEQRAMANAVELVLDSEPHAAFAVGVLHGDREWVRTWDAQPTTSFRIASVSKPFTALLAMQLAREGALDLDVDVGSYVPSFAGRRITPRMLLSHTSGLPHYQGERDGMVNTPHDTAQALALFVNRAPVAEPGARFVYSSYGYNLLAAAVETAGGASFEGQLVARILGPYGLTRTGLEDARARDPDAARGRRVRNGRLEPSERIDISARFGGGGMRSTAPDLLRFARALLDMAMVDEPTFARMITPTVTPDGKRADYGLGFAVYPQRGHLVVAHAGGQPESTSLLYLVPEERLAIVLLSAVEDQQAALSRIASAMCELLVEGGTARRKWYAEDAVDEVVLDGVARIYSHGLAGTKRMAAPLTRASALDTARAFFVLEAAFDRASVGADIGVAAARMKDLHQPFAGEVAGLVGREMARVLIARSPEGAAGLRAYHAAGPIAFFAAYADGCRARACTHPLPAQLAADVARFEEARRAHRALERWRAEDVASAAPVEAALGPLVGSALHPDFTDDLARAAARLARRGKKQDARALEALSAALHPRTSPAVLPPAAPTSAPSAPPAPVSPSSGGHARGAR